MFQVKREEKHIAMTALSKCSNVSFCRIFINNIFQPGLQWNLQIADMSGTKVIVRFRKMSAVWRSHCMTVRNFETRVLVPCWRCPLYRGVHCIEVFVDGASTVHGKEFFEYTILCLNVVSIS